MKQPEPPRIVAANKLWKEAGKPVPFGEFVERLKMGDTGSSDVFVVNRPLNDSIQQSIRQMQRQGGLTTTPNNTTVVGIPKKYVYITGGILLVGIAATIIYKKTSK